MPKRLVQYCRVADSFEDKFTTRQFAESAGISHSNATSALNSLMENGWVEKLDVEQKGFHKEAWWVCNFEEFVVGQVIFVPTEIPPQYGRTPSVKLLSLLSEYPGYYGVPTLCSALSKERLDMTDALDRLLEDDLIIRIRPPVGFGVRRNGWLYRSRFRLRA
jgi:hypothetical protein